MQGKVLIFIKKKDLHKNGQNINNIYKVVTYLFIKHHVMNNIQPTAHYKCFLSHIIKPQPFALPQSFKNVNRKEILESGHVNTSHPKYFHTTHRKNPTALQNVKFYLAVLIIFSNSLVSFLFLLSFSSCYFYYKFLL